jgi:hypothetical protein
MSKILFGVFSGVFVGAVIYELLNRSNPELTKKIEDFACKKINDVCGTSHDNVVC